MDTERIEIKQSRNMTGLICCFVLTAASIFILFKANEIGSFSTGIVRLIGCIALLFFGVGGGIAVYKGGFNTKIGLTLSGDGVLDNVSGDFIKWTSIRGLRISNVAFVKFVSIDLNDPNEFLRGQKGFKKTLGWLNYKMVGTPVNVSNSILNIKFDDLFELINRRLEYHRKNN